MPVLAWSPKNVPRNCSPVSRSPAGVPNCTVPYVFFRLLVVVPAPRFTQRPRYECPTKPSCPLFAWPRKIVALTSPCTLHVSPIDDPEIFVAAHERFLPDDAGSHDPRERLHRGAAPHEH